ncbi:MAG: hypothetical protein AAGA08_15745 [Pseudomonadota bacterium]
MTLVVAKTSSDQSNGRSKASLQKRCLTSANERCLGATYTIRNAIGICAIGLLAACENTTTSTADAPQRELSPAEAIGLFEDVCGGSLPNFKEADRIMAANRVVVPSPLGTNTTFHQSGNVSFNIVDGPGSGKTCSMVVSTNASKAKIRAATAKLGPFKSTALGKAAAYKGTLVLLQKESRIENKNYFNLRLLSAR